MSNEIPGSFRRYPVGAEVLDDGTVHVRVWAPNCQSVSAVVRTHEKTDAFELTDLKSEPDGYFSGLARGARSGSLYKYNLDNDTLLPDPASHYQPDGPSGFSQVVDFDTFAWTDLHWNGIITAKRVVYEMHIGTFTPKGTWNSAAEQLAELADLGITVIELMPTAEFAGRFGWGYDGVEQYAPYHHYGRPDDFRRFIDIAHQHGIGVLLDVVYNHFGSEGAQFKRFSPFYFSSRYDNEWGEALNFDERNSFAVREYFIHNALYWAEQFHIDGFRFDAIQQIYDSSEKYLIHEIIDTLKNRIPQRRMLFIGEDEPQDTKLLRDYGIDSVWNDDFHHAAIVALTGRAEAYYSDYRGRPEEFVACAKYGYLYQGQFYSWQKRKRGTPALDLAPEQFVNYLQNHDQIANSARGLRIHALCNLSAYRSFSALLLLSPQDPLLFQGQEFAADNPFYFFSDTPQNAKRVAQARKEFLHQFESIRAVDGPLVPLPSDTKTFVDSHIDFADRERNAGVYAMHKDLLRIRHSEPVLSSEGRLRVDGAVLGPTAFCIRYQGLTPVYDRLLVMNLGPDLSLSPIPEPLMAPPRNSTWRCIWYSEDPKYGGCGARELCSGSSWFLTGYTAYFLQPQGE